MRYHFLLYLAITVFLSACNTPARKAAGTATPPKLVVVISVDQMRYDFFERFDTLFTGGLKRLWEEGAIFSEAHHMHAPTNTAPGHATLSTGCYPAHHGILSNSVLDPVTQEEIYCVEDRQAQIIGVDHDGNLAGRSPARLRRTTVGDWLKKASRESKVYSVARKDRSAVLLGGKRADGAFWLDNLTGKFITSDYYSHPYPGWAESLEGREILADDIANGWRRKLPVEAYASLRVDSFPPESGAFLPNFPHTRDRMRPGYPDRSKDIIMMIYTPMGDSLILRFAEAIIEHEELGSGPHTDMLLVGCSAADAIGHHFGPLSHEVMDYYMYLDGYLDDFFGMLDERFGRDGYWVVLSADHGVIPMPEAMQLEGIPARRVLNDELLPLLDSLDATVREAFGLQESILGGIQNGLFINFTESDIKGFRRTDIRDAVANAMRDIDFIADVFTADELEGRTTRPYIDYFRNSHITGVSPDVVVLLKENVLVHGPTGTSHESPYDYDTHVPIVFWGKPFGSARYQRRVETVDMAPTIAALLGVKPGNVDGKVLEEIVPGL